MGPRDRHDPVPSDQEGHAAAAVAGRRQREEALEARLLSVQAGEEVEAAVPGVEQRGRVAGEDADLERPMEGRVGRALVQRQGPEQAQIGEPPDLDHVGAAAVLHRRAGGDEPVGRRRDVERVGPDRAPGDARVGGAGGTHHLAAGREQGDAAGVARPGAVAELQRGQDSSVGQPPVAVRLGVTADAVERGGESRPERVGQIEQERAARHEPVGEQPGAPGRHGQLGVVGHGAHRADGRGRHDPGIGGARGVRVDDPEEITVPGAAVVVTGEGVDVGTGRLRPAVRRRGRAAGAQDGGERHGRESAREWAHGRRRPRREVRLKDAPAGGAGREDPAS